NWILCIISSNNCSSSCFSSSMGHLFLPVMIYVLDVVIIVQHIQCFLDGGDILLIGKFHIGLRDHRHFCRRHRKSCLLQRDAHSTEILRGSQDLITVLFLGKIFCACVQSLHHKFVRISFV